MINSVDDLVDALGGTFETARIANVTPPAVSNWKARGKINPEKYFVLSAALAQAGKAAPSPKLFGFEVVKKNKRLKKTAAA